MFGAQAEGSMKRHLSSLSCLSFPVLLAAGLLASGASAQSSRPVELGLTAGYASGLGVEAFAHMPNVAGPIGVKLSAAYTMPGDSIVDSVDITGANSGLSLGTFGSYKTKGLASESGSHLTFGLDGTYSVGEVTPGISALLYAGGRYGMFSATETYAQDSNLSNTWRTNDFGVGGGAQFSYALAGRNSLVFDLGVDTYFNSSFTNGTANGTYAPGEAGYNDYRARLAFPGTVFKARVGFKVGGY